MKNDLRYQATEYDCAPTSLENALRVLFDREALTPTLLRALWQYTLDEVDDRGVPGGRGTSQRAMDFLAGWFNDYAATTQFALRARFVGAAAVEGTATGPVAQCLSEGGVVVLRIWLDGGGHYVVATGLTPTGLRVFDPYAAPEFQDLPGARWAGAPGAPYNREVDWSHLDRVENQSYALGQPDKRAAVLLWNTQGGRKWS